MMLDRTEWVSTLKVLPTEQLLSLTKDLSIGWEIHPKSVPRSGLGMLKLNDSAFEESFYLGEFPLASAWIEVHTPEGLIAEGAAQVMDERVEVAEALALSDAILSARLPGWEDLVELLDQGQAIRAASRRERKQMLARTQVDFSLLDAVVTDSMDDNDAEY